MYSRSNTKYTLVIQAADISEAKSFAFFSSPPTEALVFFLFLWACWRESHAPSPLSRLSQKKGWTLSAPVFSSLCGAEILAAALPLRRPPHIKSIPLLLSRDIIGQPYSVLTLNNGTLTKTIICMVHTCRSSLFSLTNAMSTSVYRIHYCAPLGDHTPSLARLGQDIEVESTRMVSLSSPTKHDSTS